MQTCEHCPFPRRCENQERCVAYKTDAVPVTLPEPVSVPVITSQGVGMTGKPKKAKLTSIKGLKRNKSNA